MIGVRTEGPLLRIVTMSPGSSRRATFGRGGSMNRGPPTFSRSRLVSQSTKHVQSTTVTMRLYEYIYIDIGYCYIFMVLLQTNVLGYGFSLIYVHKLKPSLVYAHKSRDL